MDPTPSHRPTVLATILRRTLVALSFFALAAMGAWYWRTHGSAPVPPHPETNWHRYPATRITDWREDIDALVQELPKRHRNAYFKLDPAELDTAALELRAAVPQLTDHQVVVGLMRLAAMIGDAHTAIGVGDVKPTFRSFPLKLYVFSDGPVIIGARASQQDLLGTTLEQFGGVPVADAFRRVMVASAYENEPTFMDQAPRLLAVPEIANAVGLIPTTDAVSIVVRDARGERRTAVLTPLDPGETLTTPTVDASKLPLSRQTRAHRNWFEPLPALETLYVRYDTCADEPGQSVAVLSERVLEAIDADHVERLVVDLRGNSGGNSGLLDSFIRDLKRRSTLTHPGGVIVLIGRYTFSSAHMNAVKLRDELGAVLIGEPTGQKPNAYGEVRWFVLPRSQIVVRYSTKFWRTESGDRPSLDPDIRVPVASSDYFALRDPVLEAALAYDR